MELQNSPLALCLILVVAALTGTVRADVTPEQLEFRREATQRMIFDENQEIPLAGFNPSKIVGLDLMHPYVGVPTGDTKF